MARKSSAILPPKEMSQEELEVEHIKRTRVLDRALPSRKGRLKNAMETPPGDSPTGEIIAIVAGAIEVNADALEWNYGERVNSATADNWARILVGAIRYGIPYDDYRGEGWHIREEELGDPPLCQSCEEEE